MLTQTGVGASKLIAVEGIDGAGKSTLCAHLLRRLDAQGYVATSLQRFMIPELTTLWLRLLETDSVDHAGAAMLAVADYHIGAERIIRPALTAGQIVVMDRYVYSHIVHYTLRGVDRGRLETLFGAWREPDVVMHLKLAPETALARKRSPRKPDFWESGLDADARGSIGAAYREHCAHPPSRDEIERRFVVQQTKAAALFDAVLPATTVGIDASQPIDVVVTRAWAAVAAIVAVQNVPADRS